MKDDRYYLSRILREKIEATLHNKVLGHCPKRPKDVPNEKEAYINVPKSLGQNGTVPNTKEAIWDVILSYIEKEKWDVLLEKISKFIKEYDLSDLRRRDVPVIAYLLKHREAEKSKIFKDLNIVGTSVRRIKNELKRTNTIDIREMLGTEFWSLSYVFLKHFLEFLKKRKH